MKIIISPAKKMKVDTDSFAVLSQPKYMAETAEIAQTLQRATYDELQALWHTNDKLTRLNQARLERLDLTHQVTPALIAYSGIQYQYMAPGVFTAAALAYVQAHLRILSGFYGILRPFDGVVPYRLEMQAKLRVGDTDNLYAYWGDKLYTALNNAGEPIINLASQEYAKTIQKYLQPSDVFIDIVFGSLVDGKVKTRATLAKMARGEMVRFMAENNVTTLDELRMFDRLNYHYQAALSSDDKLVFIDN
ncbi:peroxide stress protein YaaA [Lacticaseibacillus saniviri]